MNKTPFSSLPRRRFLSSALFGITGCCLPGLSHLQTSALQEGQSLPEELTPAERKAIGKSDMARDLDNYFHKGYSCAESQLMVGLRHLGLSEGLVWAAAGFGGGMQHREACGFLTAGIMNLGLAAGRLKIGRPEAKEWTEQRVDAYWSWWLTQAPLRCADIRKEGASGAVCRRLGLLAAAEVERLITNDRASAGRP